MLSVAVYEGNNSKDCKLLTLVVDPGIVSCVCEIIHEAIDLKGQGSELNSTKDSA